jgi:hypothetical protein
MALEEYRKKRNFKEIKGQDEYADPSWNIDRHDRSVTDWAQS